MTSRTEQADSPTLVQRVGILIGEIAFVAIGPFVVARLALQASQTYLPSAVHIVVLTIFFLLLVGWAWLITGERGEKFYKAAYEQGMTWPFLFFSFSLFLFSLPGFASLTSTLSDLGRAPFEPQIPRGDLSGIQDFYAWHFLNSIPGLGVPETLLWQNPFKYKDRLSGVILLAFKLLVIIPVIASFAVWRNVRKEMRKESKK